MDRNTQKGFTLIELLIVVVIMGILVALAAPSLFSILESRKLKGAAENFQVDLMFAKTEAIKRNTPVRMEFNVTDSNTWCYGFKVDASCDCNIANSCEIDGIEKVVSSDDYGKVSNTESTVQINGGAIGYPTSVISFTPLRGQTTNGNITFRLSDSRSVKVSTNIRGRVVICSDSGMGFAGC
jgi:type IV fimbrial biogenesis protein FimT